MVTLDDFVSFLQGASNSAASNLSAPVDGINWLLGKAGLPVSKAPVGGSVWLRQAGFTAEPKNRNAGLLGEFVGGVMPIVSAAKAPQIAAWLNQAGRNLSAPRTLNPQTGAIVWHGSPHKFDKFSTDKIGTGEGAQAYGHGLYLAEAPDVADAYRKTLSKDTFLSPNGSVINKSKLFDMGYNKGDADVMMNALRSSGGDFNAAADLIGSHRVSAARFLRAIGSKGELNTGNLYKVDIPDEAIPRFLDWDKPLSQQASEVRAALEKSKNKQLRAMLDYAKVPYSEMAGGEAKTMGEAFRLLNLNLHGKSSADSAKASALLAKQGIPGIRYLDGGSRSAGQGSSNFVVFDPEMIRILERNGQATGAVPWQPGEWRGLLGNN